MGITTQEQDVLFAEMEDQARTILAEQERTHAAELAVLKADLDRAVSDAQAKANSLQEALTASRRTIVEQARKSDAALQAAVAKASGAKPQDVVVAQSGVILTRKDAVAWVDTTLRLADDLKVAIATTELRLAEQERDIRLPYEDAIRDMARKTTGLELRNMRLETDMALAKAQLREQGNCHLKMVVAGVVVGVLALGVGYGAGYVHGAFAPP